jgi:hypothetical protein
MTGIMCALAGGSGGSIFLGNATVTVGYAAAGGFSSFGFGGGGSQGSITPTTWANSGLPFTQLKDVYSSGSLAWLDFSVTGNAPNSGWSKLIIGSVELNRADASYSYDGVTARWIFYGAPAAFGTTVGATKEITWS